MFVTSSRNVWFHTEMRYSMTKSLLQKPSVMGSFQWEAKVLPLLGYYLVFKKRWWSKKIQSHWRRKKTRKKQIKKFCVAVDGPSTAHKALSTTLNREEQRRTQLQIFDRPSSLLIGACFSGLSIGLRRLSTIRGPKTWICFLFGHIQVFFSGGVRIRISSYSKKIYF